MTQWRKTIELKQFLGEDTSDASARRCAKDVYETLSLEPESETDYRLAEIIDELSDLSRESSSDAYGGRFSLCDWLNAVLNQLYDWADSERVWIG